MTQQVTCDSQFYLTMPLPCPYLEAQMERKIFTYLVGSDASQLNNILTKGGFRRSQTIAYRPACESCAACKSVRVIVPLFKFSKSQRRVLRKNRDLIAIMRPAKATEEHYSLFRDYLAARHDDGDMTRMTYADYSDMVEESHVKTRLIEYRLRDPDSGITGDSKGDLMGVCLTDFIAGGVSMVYSFFNTEAHRRSLGTYIILDHILRAQENGLLHVYLGYWVKNSRKMEYKIRFRPLEILQSGGWTPLE